MNAFNKRSIKNVHRLTTGHFNIKSFWNKFESLEEIIKAKTNMSLVSDAKLDSSFLVGKNKVKVIVNLSD